MKENLNSKLKTRLNKLEAIVPKQPISSTRLMLGSMSVTSSMRQLVDSVERLSMDIVGVDRHGLENVPQWSKKPPKNSGMYWWYEVADVSEPIIAQVTKRSDGLYCGMTKVTDKCWRGYWLSIPVPKLPDKK